jgi:hypothetical protein
MNSIKFSNPPSAEVVKKEAYKRFAEWGPNEGKPYDEAQGAVNYIRHVLTSYDALRREIRVDNKDDENDNPEILSLKLETLAGIKERYPEYRTECTRQEEWLRGRATALAYSRAKYSSPNPGMVSMGPSLDLIGASAEETLRLNRRIGELEKALGEKEAQCQKISAELYAIRKMGFGLLYDELITLRARAGDGDRLKKYIEALRSISAVIAGLGDLATINTPPSSPKPPPPEKQPVGRLPGLRRSPAARKRYSEAAKAQWAKRRAEQAKKAGEM